MSSRTTNTPHPFVSRTSAPRETRTVRAISDPVTRAFSRNAPPSLTSGALRTVRSRADAQ